MVKKHLQAKVKHHYVWAQYLKRWSANERDVYYTTQKGNIVCESVRGVVMDKRFYQIKNLTPSHLDVIKGFSSQSPENLQEQHIILLNDFLRMQSLEALYEKSNIQDLEAEKLFYATKCNVLENLHSAHENECISIISALANRELGILDDTKNFMLFMQFFGHQIARTKTFKDTILKAVSGTNSNTANSMNDCWWFLSYMFGMNIGADLYVTRQSDVHCLLINDTEIPFITSDQPVINVHEGLIDNKIIPPKDQTCDFYYPISPQVAYMVNRSKRFERGIVNVDFNVVNELNTKIAKKSNVHIISNNSESLKHLKKLIGLHFNNVESWFT
jgi:hypothetical protein